MKITVYYLFHSGFALQTDCHFIIFDYYLDTPRDGALRDGVICPEQLAGQNVTVFASHMHSDHFNPAIFQWRKVLPGIRYILSDDIKTREAAIFVHPGQHLQYEDLTLDVLESTDEGSAFLLQTEGLTVYHAGDLNWWHWNGETAAYNSDMARRYQSQIDLLRGKHIDVAFIPLDPRLEDKAILGIDYFMRTAGAAHVFPMHFGTDLSAWKSLQKDPRSAAYREQVHLLSRRGETLSLNLS